MRFVYDTFLGPPPLSQTDDQGYCRRVSTTRVHGMIKRPGERHLEEARTTSALFRIVLLYYRVYTG